MLQNTAKHQTSSSSAFAPSQSHISILFSLSSPKPRQDSRLHIARGRSEEGLSLPFNPSPPVPDNGDQLPSNPPETPNPAIPQQCSTLRYVLCPDIGDARSSGINSLNSSIIQTPQS